MAVDGGAAGLAQSLHHPNAGASAMPPRPRSETQAAAQCVERDPFRMVQKIAIQLARIRGPAPKQVQEALGPVVYLLADIAKIL